MNCSTTSFIVELETDTDEFEFRLANVAGDNIVCSVLQIMSSFLIAAICLNTLKSLGVVMKRGVEDTKQTIEVYVDKSVIEIFFINGGKHTMTNTSSLMT
ncbi:GH32 C-terminal domain-containing protein [Vibrio chagasii]|nr:GH32 C-terminal domain-containing protein [Vibrio chagasii]